MYCLDEFTQAIEESAKVGVRHSSLSEFEY
jgi:hypothetical protein